MRIAFFGTPDFAVPTLDALALAHEVVLVVAQPDKPAGRGMRLQPPAVALRARELGLPILQPPKIRGEEFLARVREAGPDAGVVIAYGKILPAALLAIPRFGFFNVHASVLPRWRGAAPIQRAIEAGDHTTGVTIMRVDEQLDHGPMLAVATTPIGSAERTPFLARRLSVLGAGALLPVLEAVREGTAVETQQDHALATLAPKIEKREGEIRFEATATMIDNRFRAFDPWPGVFFHAAGEQIKLTDLVRTDGAGVPGTILEIGDGVVVACGEGAIRVLEMQRPGKPRTPAAIVARGLGWAAGMRLGGE